MKTSLLTRSVIASAAGLFLAALPLHASVYFSEMFDYELNTSLSGQHGASGFGSAYSWTMYAGTENLATIKNKKLSYTLGDTVLSVDQSLHVTGSNSTTRDFAYYRFETAHNVNEFYVSFLVSADSWVPVGGQIGISLANATTTTNYQYVTASQHKDNGSRWTGAVGAGSPGIVNTGTAPQTTHLIVARFYKDHSDPDLNYFNQVSLWVDPTSTVQGTPDVTTSIGSGPGRISSFLYLNIFNLNSEGAGFDIGRIVGGSSWNDVITPIPEPGVCGLGLAVAACGLVVRFRRRRA